MQIQIRIQTQIQIQMHMKLKDADLVSFSCKNANKASSSRYSTTETTGTTLMSMARTVMATLKMATTLMLMELTQLRSIHYIAHSM